MRSLIGLKNMILFSAVLLSIGSVSAQQAFAGAFSCITINDGNWNDASIWDDGCQSSFPDGGDDEASIQHDVIVTGDERAGYLSITGGGGTLFIDCDASLELFGGGVMGPPSDITNHGIFTAGQDFSFHDSTFFNSGEYSGLMPYVSEGGSIVEISSICDRPIGGTVGSMDTVSLLVAGAQANMGLWSLALVGIVGAGTAITYKLKSKKTDE